LFLLPVYSIIQFLANICWRIVSAEELQVLIKLIPLNKKHASIFQFLPSKVMFNIQTNSKMKIILSEKFYVVMDVYREILIFTLRNLRVPCNTI
jgi:hypothetical protein